MTTSLFDTFNIGNIVLKNRIIMSPMTRSRGDVQGVPSDMAIEYYRQRAGAGLVITEGTFCSFDGQGYVRTPGICTPEQLQRWQQITQAVHQEGGKIFLQIMHVGRVAHPLNKPATAKTVAPSAIQANVDMFTDAAGMQKMAMPQALSIAEISKVIDEYVVATRNAFAVGFDGVELHAGTGYLPMQFLSPNTNQRTDQYGGSIHHRVRFMVELLEALCAVQGAQKVGLRMTPGFSMNDIDDPDPYTTYSTLLQALHHLDLGYIHPMRVGDDKLQVLSFIRQHFKGTIIGNGGFDFPSGQEAINNGNCDLISYGTKFLANPDLVKRFQRGSTLNVADPNTFYTPGPEGYIDYPFERDSN